VFHLPKSARAPGTEEGDDPSVIGEEAHIVAQKADGPRGNPDFTGDLDHYNNLILLCRKHHKIVDDQVTEWSIERLRQTKAEHEQGGARESDEPPPVHLIRDPDASKHIPFTVQFTGEHLCSNLKRAKHYRFDYAAGCSGEELDLIFGGWDTLRDWSEISEDLHSLSEERDAIRCARRWIEELGAAGFIVYARQVPLLLTGGIYAEPSRWLHVDVTVVRISDILRHAHEGGEGETEQQAPDQKGAGGSI
jgi:hypothetical protein